MNIMGGCGDCSGLFVDEFNVSFEGMLLNEINIESEGNFIEFKMVVGGLRFGEVRFENWLICYFLCFLFGCFLIF